MVNVLECRTQALKMAWRIYWLAGRWYCGGDSVISCSSAVHPKTPGLCAFMSLSYRYLVQLFLNDIGSSCTPD